MIYIVILTWNGQKYLPNLFQSLANLNYPPEQYQIVVVDSGSTDSTLEFLENLKLPNLHIIKLLKNLGFAAGCNIGMQYTLDKEAEYIILLGQDTKVTPNFLNQITNTANSNPQIGIIQPLLLYYNNPQEINSWGNEIHFLGYGWTGGNHQPLSTLTKTFSPREITYASGAAVLYKAVMLKKIGLFDETLFSYHEDSDLCLRARLAGYKIVLNPQAHILHDAQFPTTKNKIRYFWMEKNRIYLLLKYYRVKTLLFVAPIWFLMDLGHFLFSIKQGYLWEFLKSRLWFFLEWQRTRQARQQIQSARTIGDRELTQNFAAEIKYQEVNNFLIEKIANPLMKLYWNFIKKFI